MGGTFPENTGVLGDASTGSVPEPVDSPVTETPDPVVMVKVDVDAAIPYLTEITAKQGMMLTALQFFAALAVVWLIYRIFQAAYRFFGSFF